MPDLSDTQQPVVGAAPQPSAQPASTNPNDVLASMKTLLDTELARSPSEFSIANFIDLLIAFAATSRSSDLHIDPTPDSIRVRFRVDGILKEVIRLPKILQSILVSRMKVMSGLRTDEHQAPQDGRFKVLLKDLGPIDVRISIMPTYYGENVELRLLQSPANNWKIEELDLSPADMQKLTHAIRRPYGMILATGPTGSGKTTMLYTILGSLNTPEVSIITIEDPIEYSIGGIEQIQVNPQAGLSFASGLRSILRQDPNIIMVGEIRDEETAEIAVNAALTGHLLLSSLHTNDAATTLARLTEFKLEPFLVASTVNVAIGQRLVRLICTNCRIAKPMSPVELQSINETIPASMLGSTPQFYMGQGCELCGHSGYHGRTGIYEILVVDEAIRQAILRRAPASEIASLAVQSGMTTMLQDGIRKAIEGKTTIEEILRVVHE